MHLVVFDIDGTLVDSEQCDARFYVKAVRNVLGIEVDDDWSKFTHVTDSGMLSEIIVNAKVKGNRSLAYAQVKEKFVGMVENHIDECGGLPPEIAGARAFVDTLKSHPEASVALATGGWKETAMMKLQAIGIDPQELCLASSSDSVSRIEIMKIAEQRALLGRPAARRTYFGDGPWDKTACQELGYEFIVIGSGVKNPTRYADFRDAERIQAELRLNTTELRTPID